MKKKLLTVLLAVGCLGLVFTGCSNSKKEANSDKVKDNRIKELEEKIEELEYNNEELRKDLKDYKTIADYNKRTNEEDSEAPETKLVGLGEEAVYKENGKPILSLIIQSSSKTISPGNETYSKDLENPIEIKVTFKNLGSANPLGFRKQFLQVFDETGVQANESLYQHGQDEVDQGRNADSVVWYGLKNASSKIQLDYRSFDMKETLKFEVPLD